MRSPLGGGTIRASVTEEIEKMKVKNIARIVLVGALLLILAPSMTTSQEFYEACYHFLGDYPDQVGAPWTRECQGLAHDTGHWFITLNNAAGAGVDPDPQIWKVPVTQDLETLDDDSPGILITFIMDWAPVSSYNHVGDVDYYEYEGTGYLVMPLTLEEHPNILAIFRASDLAYVAHAQLAGDSGGGWCAADPDGYLYFPNYFPGDVVGVAKYYVDWNAVHTSGQCVLPDPERIHCYFENGTYFNRTHAQGGEFTPSGELFYMVTGINDTDYNPDYDGIHVFETQTWYRVQHSVRGYWCFNYDYDPSTLESEEPEGITIWDLDGAGAPGISGQVHVILLDNDAYDWDDVYIKHYAGFRDIYVFTGHPLPGCGRPEHPFLTVGEANYFAWNGAILHIFAGYYPEAVTFQKRMEVTAWVAPVIIGTSAP